MLMTSSKSYGAGFEYSISWLPRMFWGMITVEEGEVVLGGAVVRFWANPTTGISG